MKPKIFFYFSFIILFCCIVFCSFGQSKTDSVLNILKTIKHDTAKVNLLVNICDELSLKDPGKALKYGKHGLLLSQKAGYVKGIAQCCNIIGVIFKDQGKYDEALGNIYRSVKIGEALGDKKILSNYYNNIGNVMYLKTLYSQALRYYQKSLLISEELKDSTKTASCYMNIGSVHRVQNNKEKALEYYEKSLEIYKETGDLRGVSYNLINIGNINGDNGNYNKALKYFNESLTLNLRLGEKKLIAYCYNNIGSVYRQTGNYAQALLFYTKSLKIKEELDDVIGISYHYNNIAELYLLMKNYSQASEYSQKAFNIALQIGAADVKKEACKILSAANDSLKNYKSALEYYKLYSEVGDSSSSEEIKKKIAEMEARYQSEKKEKEITVLQKEKEIKELEASKQKNLKYVFVVSGLALLIISIALFFLLYQNRKSNKELTLLNQKLNESESHLIALNNTKTRFFSIISHDLRSPLLSLKSSFDLFMDKRMKFSEAELGKYSSSISKSVGNIVNLLENLLYWSKAESEQITVRPVDFCFFEIAEEIIQLAELKLAQKNISLSGSIDREIMVYADKEMIKFVMRNIIDNAIKFTGSGGKISVDAQDANDFLIVKISDTGIGIAPENTGKLFNVNSHYSTPGTEKEKGTGLGLMLCKDFIIKNKGEISFESKLNEGTVFTLKIPLAF